MPLGRTTRSLLRSLVIIALLMSGFAMAEAEEGPPTCRELAIEGDLAHSAQWICSVARLADALNIVAWIDGVAWAILIAVFVARTLQISLAPNPGPKMRGFLTAALFSFGLMISLTAVRDTSMNIWVETHDFSQGRGPESIMLSLAGLAEDLNAPRFADALTGIAVADEIEAIPAIEGAGAAAAAAAASPPALRSVRIGAVAGRLANLARGLPILRIIDAVLVPVLALYSMIVFGSALTVLVAGFLLPVGAIMLLTGRGEAFFSNWVNVMLASLLTMLIFPLMWGVAMEVAVVAPIREVVATWVETTAEYQEVIDAAAPSEYGGFIIGPIRTWLSHARAAAESFVPSVIALLQFGGSIVTMVFQMLLGLITAFGLIFLLQSIITKFIGGMAATAKAGSFSQLLGGGLKGRGGKNTSETSTKTTTNNNGGGSGGSGGGEGSPATGNAANVTTSGGTGPLRPDPIASGGTTTNSAPTPIPAGPDPVGRFATTSAEGRPLN